MQLVALLAHFSVKYILQKLKGFSVCSSPPGVFFRCLQGFVDKHTWRFGATGTWQRKGTFSTTTPQSPLTARAPQCSSRLTNLSTNPSRKVKPSWTICQTFQGSFRMSSSVQSLFWWLINSLFSFFSLDKPLYGDFWPEASQRQGKENFSFTLCNMMECLVAHILFKCALMQKQNWIFNLLRHSLW